MAYVLSIHRWLLPEVSAGGGIRTGDYCATFSLHIVVHVVGSGDEAFLTCRRSEIQEAERSDGSDQNFQNIPSSGVFPLGTHHPPIYGLRIAVLQPGGLTSVVPARTFIEKGRHQAYVLCA